MWKIGLVILLLAGGAEAAEYRTHEGMRLPDARVTPGATTTMTRAAICTTKWGKDVRHVTPAMKTAVYAAYGAVKRKGVCCEVDHLVSKELGGADEMKNLWPQPWTQARMKDRLENALHRDLCATPPRLTLEQAQHAIRHDWYAEWKRRFAR